MGCLQTGVLDVIMPQEEHSSDKWKPFIAMREILLSPMQLKPTAEIVSTSGEDNISGDGGRGGALCRGGVNECCPFVVEFDRRPPPELEFVVALEPFWF